MQNALHVTLARGVCLSRGSRLHADAALHTAVRTHTYWQAQRTCSRHRPGAHEGATLSAQAAAATQQASALEPAQDRASHNDLQAAAFDADTSRQFLEPLEEGIAEKLEYIVRSVPALDTRDISLRENAEDLPYWSAPRLGSNSRVIDGGSGTGALIPFLQAQGVRDILAVDVSPDMLKALRSRFPNPGHLGNRPGVRTWEGDVADLPAAQFQGSAAVFLNAMFGNVFDQWATLATIATKLPPTAHIVISHPLGRAWLKQLHVEQPETVPHPLPSQPDLESLISDLPLRLVAYEEDSEFYMAVLQVPRLYAFEGAPAKFSGAVEKGFGRGSRQLGFPTANLPPAAAEGLPRGVYFGWAQLQPPEESGAADTLDTDFEVHPMVLNIGCRPTMQDDGGVTVEVHVLHTYRNDFYHRSMRAIAIGFLRPEQQFNGINELKAQIRADIGSAKSQLVSWQAQQWLPPHNDYFSRQ